MGYPTPNSTIEINQQIGQKYKTTNTTKRRNKTTNNRWYKTTTNNLISSDVVNSGYTIKKFPETKEEEKY